MTGNEWQNIQDIFVWAVGQWISFYVGLAVAGSLALAMLNIIWRRVPRVKIIGGEEYDDA